MNGVRALPLDPLLPSSNLYDDAVELWSMGVGWQEAGDYFTEWHPDIKWIYALWDRSYSRDCRDARRNCSKIRCFRLH